MTKVESACFTVDADFLFFEVKIEKDNHDRHSFAFRVAHLTEYRPEDMALKSFISGLKGIICDLEKHV